MSEDGVRRRNPSMTGQRQIESPAHAVSVNRCIYRGRELRDRIHQILAHPRKIQRGTPGNFLDLTEFGSGGKKLRIAGEDERFGIPL